MGEPITKPKTSMCTESRIGQENDKGMVMTVARAGEQAVNAQEEWALRKERWNEVIMDLKCLTKVGIFLKLTVYVLHSEILVYRNTSIT